MPPLSVVMPVHNTLPHLDAAIESILGQSFSDFEFVILDDASTDGSGERLKEWAKRDARIRLLRSTKNLGPVGSSNMVANAARAPIVARMDGDDLSDCSRLAEQLTILESRPKVGVVGSLCDIIDDKGKIIRAADAWRLRRQSPFVPFAHGAMMYRRSVFEQVGGYRDDCAYWEDQDLVVRMAAVSQVLVIQRPLYQIRAWTKSTRAVSDNAAIEQALHAMFAATDRLRETQSDAPAAGTHVNASKIDPRVFRASGAVRLWAGERPRLFNRLLARGDLSLNARSLGALVWTAWATTSPGSLRTFLKLLLRLRNMGAPRRHPPEPIVVWDPFDEQPQERAAPAPVRTRSAA